MKKLRIILSVLVCLVLLIPTAVSAKIDSFGEPVHLYVDGAVASGPSTKTLKVFYQSKNFAATRLCLTLQSADSDAVDLLYDTLDGYNGTVAKRNDNGVIEVTNPNGIGNGPLFAIQAAVKKPIATEQPIEIRGKVVEQPTNGPETRKGIFQNGAIIAPRQKASFSIDLTKEADLVRVNINLAEAYTYIGAIQFDFDYDETYLEIVKSPFTGKFLTVTELEKEYAAWAANEQTLLFAAATAYGIRENGAFITAYFRVIKDIPAGQVATISARLDLAPVTCLLEDVTYETTIHNGGVTGVEGTPGNKLFDQQETGIEAIVPAEDPLQKAQLVTESLEQTDRQAVFDISFEKDGKEQQPQSLVVVRVPVPEGMDGSLCHVYRTEEDGSVTDMLATCHDDYLTFETDHFSQYTLSQEALATQSIDLSAHRLLYGDVNNDGNIDARDALLSLKKAVNLVDFTVLQHAAGDVNNDRDIDAKDALLILQRAVGKAEFWPL